MALYVSDKLKAALMHKQHKIVESLLPYILVILMLFISLVLQISSALLNSAVTLVIPISIVWFLANVYAATKNGDKTLVRADFEPRKSKMVVALSILSLLVAIGALFMLVVISYYVLRRGESFLTFQEIKMIMAISVGSVVFGLPFIICLGLWRTTASKTI